MKTLTIEIGGMMLALRTHDGAADLSGMIRPETRA